MTLEELQQKATAQMEAFATSIEVAQSSFVDGKGKYFQGPATVSAVPVNGVDVLADGFDTPLPTKTETWEDLGVAIPSMCVQVHVDEYILSDKRAGWMMRGYVVDDKGVAWIKVIDRGLGRFDRKWTRIDEATE